MLYFRYHDSKALPTAPARAVSMAVNHDRGHSSAASGASSDWEAGGYGQAKPTCSASLTRSKQVVR